MTTPSNLARLVRHDLLEPSPSNPRKRFDPRRLAELAASMAPPVGILERLVVRPKGDRFEIIAGERRWRAAKIAGITEVPVDVRDLTDEQVIEVQIIENDQRDDIHPLERAAAFDRWLTLNKSMTPKTIGGRIGMSERYVQNVLHYLKLEPGVAQAFVHDHISAGHADLLVRLSAADQKRALKEGCFTESLNFSDDGLDGLDGYDTLRENNKPVKRLRSVRELDLWIKGSIRLALEPSAPTMEFFPEVKEAVTAEKVKDAPRLLEVIDSHEYYPKDKTAAAPLTRQHWVPVKKGEKCDTQHRAVVVLGTRRGELLTVCTGVGTCKVHWKHTIREREKKRQLAVAKEREQGKLYAKVINAGIAAAKKKLPTTPTPALLRLLANNRGESGLRLKKYRWSDLAVEELAQIECHNDHFYGGPQGYVREKELLGGFGVDMRAIEKELLPAAAPTKTAKIKAARESLKKAASKGIRKALAKRKRKAGKKR